MRGLWIIVAIMSALGALTLLLTIGGANGAPQEAAGSAMAVAFAVIPYCFVRAVAELSRK